MMAFIFDDYLVLYHKLVRLRRAIIIRSYKIFSQYLKLC